MSAVKVSVPKFSSKKSFALYEAEIEAWSDATETADEKKGLIVALSLPEEDPSQIRDKVFTELDREKLKTKDGLIELIKYLKGQFGKDDLSDLYEKYCDFEKCVRNRVA